jgi:ELWxxDGT repeat protein
MSPNIRAVIVVSALSLTGVLTACGGGGENNSAPNASFLLLSADNGATGTELYRTDDTGVISLVKNINTNTSSKPQSYMATNGALFFSATDGVHGRELWKSEANSSGAALVKDINPGIAGSSPIPLAVINGTLFFVADDGVNGRELWKTNGSTAGTTLVFDINPGLAGSFPGGTNNFGIIPGDYIVLKNELYFVADDGSHGPELWRTDGTTTTLVAELNTGAANWGPQNLAILNGELYFLCYCNSTSALWKTNGSLAGTAAVTVGIPNPTSGVLTAFNGALYFAASDITHGSGLWQYDASTSSSKMIKGINTVTGDARIRNLTVINNRLYFSADDGVSGEELWTSDGTEPGTSLVKDIYPGVNNTDPNYIHANGSAPINFAEFNGEAYFVAIDGVHGYQLWKSNGAESGTVMLTNFTANGAGRYGFSPLIVNEAVYFTFVDTGRSQHLWKSDGTPMGTTEVMLPAGHSVYAEPYSTNSGISLTVFNNKLYLPISDGVHGYELWQSDGTSTGTTLVADINTAYDDTSLLSGGVWYAGMYYFTADDGIHGRELWKTDGTLAGTQLVKDIHAGVGSSTPRSLTVYNGALYFIAYDATGIGLWKTNGTPSGTGFVAMVLSSASLTESSNSDSLNLTYASTLSVFHAELYFTANDGLHGQELWKTDGTTTAMIKDINPNKADSSPHNFMENNGNLYFVADDGGHGPELWKTDGTRDGTMLVRDVYPGWQGASPSFLTSFNGELYFNAHHPDYGFELWKTDGTANNTTLVKDINNAVSPSNDAFPFGLTVLNGALYFFADDGVHGQGLWRSDGQATGTDLVKNIFPVGWYDYALPGTFNAALYFIANDGQGDELWRSDGTPTGTTIVKNLNPAKTNSDPLNVFGIYYAGFTNFNNTLYFFADDGTHGAELWKMDATTLATQLVQDLNPGANPGVSLIHPLP